MPRALRTEVQKYACLPSMTFSRGKPAKLNNHYLIQKFPGIVVGFPKIHLRTAFKLKTETNMTLNHRLWPQWITGQ